MSVVYLLLAIAGMYVGTTLVAIICLMALGAPSYRPIIINAPA